MTLSQFLKPSLIAAFLFCTPMLSAQQEVEIKTQKLSDTLYVLFGQGGNIGVSAGEDGVYIIDDQFAELTDKIKAAISEISDKPIKFVINTHWHFDHTGGNENFGKTDSTIIAHDNVYKRMKGGGYVQAADQNFEPAPKDALPVITFNDTLTLHLNNEEARVFHVKNAHTDGDGVIWFEKSNVIHMGDTFFNGVYPFIDHDSDGSLNGIIAAADMVLNMIDDGTQVIPGHGPVTDKAGLKAYRDMCVAIKEAVQKMKQDGMSVEEIIAANPSADFDENWNAWGTIWKNRFIAAVYDDV